jgi:hypothetical protein
LEGRWREGVFFEVVRRRGPVRAVAAAAEMCTRIKKGNKRRENSPPPGKAIGVQDDQGLPGRLGGWGEGIKGARLAGGGDGGREGWPGGPTHRFDLVILGWREQAKRKKKKSPIPSVVDWSAGHSRSATPPVHVHRPGVRHKSLVACAQEIARGNLLGKGFWGG